jgi:putative aminopeptidase FrvX
VEWKDTVMRNERVRVESNTDFEVEGTVGQETTEGEEDGKEKESDLWIDLGLGCCNVVLDMP